MTSDRLPLAESGDEKASCRSPALDGRAEGDPNFGLRRLSQQELDEICRRHTRFLNCRTGGARANLSHCDLTWPGPLQR